MADGPPLPPPGHPPRVQKRWAAPPRWAHVPGLVLLAAIWAAWVWHLPTGGIAGWGLSGAALAQGRWETIGLHMFAHAGLIHIGFNALMLFALAAPLTMAMGAPPQAWLRFAAFYLLSGLAGAGLYLAFHPDGSVPMVGASGAISGLIGLFSRLRPGGGPMVRLWSAEMGRRVWDFAKANLVLIALITVPIMLLGGSGGIAWEAHLGGFLFGLVAGPAFTVRPAR